MDKQQFSSFFTKMLEEQSYDAHVSRVPDLIISTLKSYGLKPKLIQSKGIKNIVCTTGGQTKLMFNGHWDTVLPSLKFKKQLLPVKNSGNKIYGLGACDMKSGVAVMVRNIIECYKSGISGVGVSLVGDEEKGGENGTKVLIKQGYSAPFIILGEPTSLAISMGQKTGIRFKITVNGKAAHAAYPHRGENAILKLNRIINRLTLQFPTPLAGTRDEEVYPLSTISINLINGGSSENVVPANATLLADCRIDPKTDLNGIISRVSEIVEEEGGTLQETPLGQGWHLQQQSFLHKLACKAIESTTGNNASYITKMGTNDGKYYSQLKGVKIINIGPGSNKLSHTEKEFVSPAELETCFGIYQQISRSICLPQAMK